MTERVRDDEEIVPGRVSTVSREQSNRDKPAGRTFRTLKEIKDTFFPNVPLEQLEGNPTDEQVIEDLRKLIEIAGRNVAIKNPRT